MFPSFLLLTVLLLVLPSPTLPLPSGPAEGRTFFAAGETQGVPSPASNTEHRTEQHQPELGLHDLRPVRKS